ncbi:hypothetical protein HWV62_8285 [Athelia sp. TMB]|nr:hypothetical protein HWV62_8285 [Athelia sp. TMB]
MSDTDSAYYSYRSVESDWSKVDYPPNRTASPDFMTNSDTQHLSGSEPPRKPTRDRVTFYEDLFEHDYVNVEIAPSRSNTVKPVAPSQASHCRCQPSQSLLIPPPRSRNLVVCIDGTSNQFGVMNTNVIELYSHILKGENDGQLTYYDSGIGTYARPSWRSWTYLKQVVINKIDLAIACAYDLYARHEPGVKGDVASTFKKTFSRPDVRTHFIGAWDTVSSVSFLRQKKLLPRVADCCNHVCYFRHALALDECRVKFLPEYVHEGISHTQSEAPFPGQDKCTADIKEVWFAGSHSDVGGGNRVNQDLQSGDIPLLWMRNEAIKAGLSLSAADINWKSKDLERLPTNSLTFFWKIIEQLPIPRLSYKGRKSLSYKPHRGKSRKIVPGQKIHVSVIFRPKYRPLPAFPKKLGNWPAQLQWGDPDRHARLSQLDDIWERDLFDHTAAKDLFVQLEADRHSHHVSARILERIAFMASSDDGRSAILNLAAPLAPRRELLSVMSTTTHPSTPSDIKSAKVCAGAAYADLIPTDQPPRTAEFEETAAASRNEQSDAIFAEEQADITPAQQPIETMSSVEPENNGPAETPIDGSQIAEPTDIKSTMNRLPTKEPPYIENIKDSDCVNLAIELLYLEPPVGLGDRKNSSKRKKATVVKKPEDQAAVSNTRSPKEPPKSISPSLAGSANVVLQEMDEKTRHSDVNNTPPNIPIEASYTPSALDRNKLLTHASLAVAAFARHDALREEMIMGGVPRQLVLICGSSSSSEDLSTTAAQALLYMLEFKDVVIHMDTAGDVRQLVDIVVKKTKFPITALRILEVLGKYGRTRTVLAQRKVIQTLFDLLDSSTKNYINICRLNTLCQLAFHDNLLDKPMETKIVRYLIKGTSLTVEKQKRLACLAGLVLLSDNENMCSKIVEAGFVATLMRQLLSEQTDTDAQDTLVALYKYKQYRVQIIRAKLLETLVKRLAKDKTFESASHTLIGLVEYDGIRPTLLKLPFITTLEIAIEKGGVQLDRLGDAMGSFCEQTEIQRELLNMNFVPMLYHIVHDGALFSLTFIPAILSGVGPYESLRNEILATDIIETLVQRLKGVSISNAVFKDHFFHDAIESEFVKYGVGDIERVSFSLRKIFRLSHENVNMIRSFLYMMLAHPRGFAKMLKYGNNNDW